jgi:hypothetical protein
VLNIILTIKEQLTIKLDSKEQQVLVLAITQQMMGKTQQGLL